MGAQLRGSSHVLNGVVDMLGQVGTCQSACLLATCQQGPGSPGGGGGHGVMWTFCYPPNVTGYPNT